MIVMLYPFWNTIAVSLNHSQDTLKGGITLFPRVFSTYNYETVFSNRLLVIATINSVLRTLLSTVLGVFVAAMIAYVLSGVSLSGASLPPGIFLSPCMFQLV
jgi:putative aldouronate transport system permease protein